MMSDQDRSQLDQAAALLRGVIERHRGGDLRALSVFTSALQEIRIGERYLESGGPPAANGLP